MTTHRLALSLLWLAAAPAFAQVPDAEMARCAAIGEPMKRLACLDALAAQAVARLPARTPTEAQAKTALQDKAVANAQASTQVDNFGAATLPKPAPDAKAPDVIESQIEGMVEEWRPNMQFRLKNGQVWRVSDGSSGSVGKRDPKVKIRRNMFGTFFLEFEGMNASPKVRRVQ